MDDLAAALRKAAVDSKWLATFEDEELDLRLLRDMKNLYDNLQELGLSVGESRRLAEVIKAPPAAAQASAPAGYECRGKRCRESSSPRHPTRRWKIGYAPSRSACHGVSRRSCGSYSSTAENHRQQLNQVSVHAWDLSSASVPKRPGNRGARYSAVGKVHGDFKANTQVGVAGFSPHGSILLLLRGFTASAGTDGLS